MKIVFILLALVAAYLAFETARTIQHIRISAKLIEDAHGFTRENGERTLLILGDSTAVGVGSPSDLSVAGRLSSALDASAENYAMSGAQTKDLTSQVAHAQKEMYDMILVQIGANDIIRFHNTAETVALLDESLKLLRQKSDHVVLLTAGKVGKAPFFPHGLGWLWTSHARKMRAEFMSVTEKNSVAYIDLYNIPDPFNADPERYYAPDGLHLTGDGYGFWFDAVQSEIAARWPTLLMR